jgi:trimeric autotransporter adhesin
MARGGTTGAIALGGGLPKLGPAPECSGRSRAWVAGWLVGAAALACAAALVLLHGATAGRAPVADAPASHQLDLLSLPAAAQGAVSAALGGEPAYRIRGLHAINRAQHLRMGFSRRGVAVASGGGRLSMALSAYGYASALRPLAVASPHATANRVSYPHGSLTEWFANGPLGLEQGFNIAARPPTGSGPLTLSLAISGNLAARVEDGSVLLDGGGAALRYGGLLATDARGHVLRSWLQLARGQLLVHVDDRGATYPLRIDPFLQQAELTAKEGAQEEEFGDSVAVSGNTIVVGAPNREVGGDMERGEAYVFTRPSSGWASATEAADLTAENGKAGDRLGQAVAVSGNTVVVGAPDHEVGAHNEQGAADVFSEPSGGWGSKKAGEEVHQAAELIASGGATDDKLGSSVAVSGSVAVAGAPDHAFAHEKQGEAYVFREPSGGWGSNKVGELVTQAADLVSSGGAAKDELGRSVAVSGDTAVAGAPGHKVGENEEQGAAYVFSEPSGGWGSNETPEEVTQSAELIASNGAKEDGLELSVAVSASTVILGTPRHKVGSIAAKGAAYVFTEPGGGWGSKKAGEQVTQTAELTASDGAEDDGLGASVAVSGSTVVAGAPEHKVGNNPAQGAAYVFVMPVSGWAGSLTQSAELSASDGAAMDALGRSVAVSGDTVLAGAPNHTVAANAEQGAAYVFEEPPSVSVTVPVNGATYTQGQVVPAEYSCLTAPGTTVACSGPVSPGVAIETGTLGPHTFTVDATDSDALGATQSVSYTVVPAPAATPLAPILSSLSQTAKTWREGSLLAQISDRSKKKKPPVGTTFSFTLNEAASVTFAFTKQAAGRRVGKKCVAQSRGNRHKRRCTRTVSAGTLTFSGRTGTNKVRFEGLISKHRKLKPGSYTLLVIATASSKRSTTSTLHFTIAA